MRSLGLFETKYPRSLCRERESRCAEILTFFAHREREQHDKFLKFNLSAATLVKTRRVDPGHEVIRSWNVTGTMSSVMVVSQDGCCIGLKH